MKKMNKRAISPVIATVLLISLVLVLAAIIFLWAKAFIPEQIQKFDSPIANACGDVVFSAAHTANGITIQNDGNVPIYSIQVGKKSLGSIDYVEASPRTVVTGGSWEYEVAGLSNGEIVVVPVLLGKTSDGQLKAFPCSDTYAKTISA